MPTLQHKPSKKGNAPTAGTVEASKTQTNRMKGSSTMNPSNVLPSGQGAQVINLNCERARRRVRNGHEGFLSCLDQAMELEFKDRAPFMAEKVMEQIDQNLYGDHKFFCQFMTSLVGHVVGRWGMPANDTPLHQQGSYQFKSADLARYYNRSGTGA
jgi:hypothetical protein